MGEAQRGEAGFDLGALVFQPGRQGDVGAEGFGGFVGGEAGGVGGDFEEGAAGFAEVDGVEVIAVHDGRDVEPVGTEGVEPGGLLVVRGCAKGDVVDLPCADARAGGWGEQNIDDWAGVWARILNLEAMAAVVARHALIAEAVDEDAGGEFFGGFGEGDAVQAADGVARRGWGLE